MCGIVVFMNPTKKGIDSDQAARATRSIQHRGLRSTETIGDDMDMYVYHRRLPINGLDIQADHPIVTDKALTWMVGEYYWYNREEWVSDTEELAHHQDAHPYVQYPGMYHMVRRVGDSLFVYQDPLGKKPIYYRHDIGGLASEIKPLTVIPATPNKAYYDSLKDGNLPSIYSTPYLEITQLNPGIIYEFNLTTNEVFHHKPLPLPHVSLYEDQPLSNRLKASLGLRMEADVQIGMLVSGGLDSSLLYTLARNKGHNPRVFHMDNNEESYLRILRIPEDRLTKVDYPVDALDDIPEVLYYNETPMDLGSMLPQYYLGKAIRKVSDIKVLVTGDGADELFAGYSRAQQVDTRAYDLDELRTWHLPRLDKMSMAWTIELRAPYLDEMIVDFSREQEYWQIKNKLPLKTIANSSGVPQEIINRPKLPLKSNFVRGDKKGWQDYLIKEFYKRYSRGLLQ